MISQTEENYLKAIFKLSEITRGAVNTNAIAAEMNTTAASVTDMLKRLTEKELTIYERYRGVTLTVAGSLVAKNLIRRHRLWEVFLVEHLQFTWDEVHELAEQLEHIHSDKLIRSLDSFLGHPKFDPHGDPIPDEHGNISVRRQIRLNELPTGERGVIVGVNEHSSEFLKFLEQLGLVLGTSVQVLERYEYDHSTNLLVGDSRKQIISVKVSQNIFVNQG